MLNINEIQNPQGFAQDFLNHYFASGSGGMQKRDLDTLVFGLLLKYGAFGGSANAADTTEISFQLGISLLPRSEPVARCAVALSAIRRA
ncbi:MAG: hypothetical protein MZV65_35795 [Chromatiales bacterium]|nr:hypothetical protein [Chromatiales bacterium]